MRFSFKVGVAALLLAWQTGMAPAMTPPLPVVLREATPDYAGQPRPGSFAFHAASDIGDGSTCVVGADFVPGEAVRKAVVLRVDNETGTIIWNRSLRVPTEIQGSAATHCMVRNGGLYVLVQSTQSAPYFPPQTFLSIARLDAASGELAAANHVGLPAGFDNPEFGSDRRYSAWVDPDADRVSMDRETVLVKARYIIIGKSDGTTPLIKRSKTQDAEIRLDTEYLMPSD